MFVVNLVVAYIRVYTVYIMCNYSCGQPENFCLSVIVSICNNLILIFIVIKLLVTLYLTSLRLVDHLW